MKISRFLVAYLMGITVAFSAPIGIMIPAYIDPIKHPEAWSELVATAKSGVPLTVIVNPASGPDVSGAPGLLDVINGNIKALRGAGARVIGYVDTDYTMCDGSAVMKEVQAYIDDYEPLDGFFLDRLTNDGDKDHLSYYQGIRLAIATLNKAYWVVGNPGGSSTSLEDYLASPVSLDELVTFESDVNYSTTQADSWVRRHIASHFSNLPWKVATEEAMEDYVTTAKARNVGHIYVTDDGVDGNPWDMLPSYWEDEVRLVKALNAADLPVKVEVSSSGGAPTVTVSGSPGVYELQASGDLEQWAPLEVQDLSTGSFQVPDTGAGNSAHRFYRVAQ